MKNLEKYLPAFRGCRAFGVSLGIFFPIEIDTWDIVDGHVFFQYSKETREKSEAH